MRLIQNIDFLGNEPKPFIFKKSLYKTYLGGCFSLLTAVAIMTFSLYFIVIAFQRQQVNLLSGSTTKFDKKLNFSEIPFLFYPANKDGILYNSSIVYPVMQFWDYSADLKGNVKVTNMPMKQCEYSDVLGYEHLFPNYTELNQKYCMDKSNKNLTMFGDYGDIVNGYSKVHVYIGKCKNDSVYNPNPGKCLPQQSIDAALSILPLHLYTTFPDWEIDFNNVTDPYISYLRTEDFLMAYTAMNTYVYYLKRTWVYSDLGFVFEDKDEKHMYQWDNTQSITLLGSAFYVTEGYGLVMIALNSKADIHNRSYIKLQALVANVGGVTNFILMLAKLLTHYISSKSLLLEYVNHRLTDHKSDGDSSQIEVPNKVADNNTIGITTNLRTNNYTQIVAQQR
jgi:hypothetical protein